MNNNLPIKKEYSIIFRIKNFFRKLFNKEDSNYSINDSDSENKNIYDDKMEGNFGDNLKVEVSNEYVKEITKNDFIDEIEKNPDLLYNLSIDRLKKLEKYYDELIEKDKEELKNIKKTA